MADVSSARFGNLVILFLATVYPIIGMVLATFLVGPLAVFCVVSTAFFSGVRWPILDFLLQQEVTTQQRATISSFQGVLQRALYALVALLLGVLATQFGIVSGIRWAAILLVVNIIGLLLLFPARRRPEPSPPF